MISLLLSGSKPYWIGGEKEPFVIYCQDFVYTFSWSLIMRSSIILRKFFIKSNYVARNRRQDRNDWEARKATARYWTLCAVDNLPAFISPKIYDEFIGIISWSQEARKIYSWSDKTSFLLIFGGFFGARVTTKKNFRWQRVVKLNMSIVLPANAISMTGNRSQYPSAAL